MITMIVFLEVILVGIYFLLNGCLNLIEAINRIVRNEITKYEFVNEWKTSIKTRPVRVEL